MCHSDRQATALHAEGKLSVKDTVAEKEEDPRMSRAHKKQRFTQKQLHQERRQQRRQCRKHQQLHWKKRQKAAAPLDTPVSTAMLRPQTSILDKEFTVHQFFSAPMHCAVAIARCPFFFAGHVSSHQTGRCIGHSSSTVPLKRHWRASHIVQRNAHSHFRFAHKGQLPLS